MLERYEVCITMAPRHKNIPGNFRADDGVRGCLNEMLERYEACITWASRQKNIPGNCGADDLARMWTTIEISDEFSALGIRLDFNRKCSKTMRKIWPRLDRRCTETMLKLQRSNLSTVSGVITWHCFIRMRGVYVLEPLRVISAEAEISSRNEKDDKII